MANPWERDTNNANDAARKITVMGLLLMGVEMAVLSRFWGTNRI
jgi:hypothetical protein